MASDITISSLRATGGVSQIILAWFVVDPNRLGLPYLQFQAAEVWWSRYSDMSDAALLGVSETGWVDTPVRRGERRYYRVRAINQVGEYGEWSAIVRGDEVSGNVLLDSFGFWAQPNGLVEYWGYMYVAGGSGDAQATVAPIGTNQRVLNLLLTVDPIQYDLSDLSAGYLNVWTVLSKGVTKDTLSLALTVRANVRRVRAPTSSPGDGVVGYAPDGVAVQFRLMTGVD